MSNVKVVALAGSLRKDSYNQKLVRIAAAGAREAGADVEEVNLKDYPMPIFNEDIEASEGPPEAAVKLKKLFIDADAILISSPEYNSSVTAALKNALDWISRTAKGEKALVAFDGKIAVIMSASPGALGGLRGLVHLRSILGNIKMLILPDQVAITAVHEAFTEDGKLADPAKQNAVTSLGIKAVEFARRLNNK